MTNEPSSRDRLIAGALAGELNAEEQREFDAACSADPELLAEYRALLALSGRLAQSDLGWDERELPPGLADRVFAATGSPGRFDEGRTGSSGPAPAEQLSLPAELDARRGAGGTADGGTSGGRPRRPVVRLGLAAAGLLILGGVGGSALSGLLQTPPEGPPGMLGAVEEVTFPAVPAGTSFDAALVAHTWGTETVLEVDGLTVGESFEVILVSEAGEELTSGTFFGAEQTVTCRMNAALLREDVSELQIRDETGTVVVSSTVPDV